MTGMGARVNTIMQTCFFAISIGQEYGPLIAPGMVDLLLSFDLMETARFCHYLKEDGLIVTSREFVVPTSVYMDDFPAPDGQTLLSFLGDRKVIPIDARVLAEKAGSILTQNIVLLGAASVHLPLQESSLREAIGKTVPKKTIEVNLLAFGLGRSAGLIE